MDANEQVGGAVGREEVGAASKRDVTFGRRSAALVDLLF